MNPDLDALGLRAVACPRWRWLPGMKNQAGTRIVRVEKDGYMVGIPRGWKLTTCVDTGYPPDLADPATLGCLLALVREAYEDDFIGLEYDAPLGKWGAYAAEKGVWSTRLRGEGNTEAEALVVALEAAP